MWQWQTFTLIKIGHCFRKTCRTLTLTLSLSLRPDSMSCNDVLHPVLVQPLWPFDLCLLFGSVAGSEARWWVQSRLQGWSTLRVQDLHCLYIIYTSLGPWLSWLSCIHLDHLGIAWQTFSHTFFAEVFLQQFLSAFGLPNSMWSHGPRLAALESLVFRTAYVASQTGNALDVLRYHTKDGRKHPSEACDDGNNWDQDSENLNGNQCSNYQCY